VWLHNQRQCRQWCGLAAAVLLLLAIRLPFVSPSLDNIDSINFDLGAHDYDPGLFQPHPPGFPVYIAVARAIHRIVRSHAAALAAVSALFGALSAVPLYGLMHALLRRWGTPRWGAALACLVTLLNPTLWFNSVRPMSDITAFFFITSAQSLLVLALVEEKMPGPRRRLLWLAGAAIAGVSPGVRLQAIWCVGPLLLYGVWRLPPLRLATTAVFSAALAAWAVPMLILSGGLTRYSDSVFALLSGAVVSGEPIVGNLTLHEAAARAVDVLVTPWQDHFLALAILGLAAIGAVMLVGTERRLLALVAVVFAPYAVYHYLLQDTATVRYAMPIVPAVALLASLPIVYAGQRIAFMKPLAVVSVVAATAAVTIPALEAYHATSSPAWQALAAADRLQRDSGADVPPKAADSQRHHRFILSGHHVFERYLMSAGDTDVILPTEGARRTLLRYWKAGGRTPVLFMRDPQRTTLLFFGRDGQQSVGSWAWPQPVRRFMQGERPSDVELVRLTPPRWLGESGVMLSPEAGPLDQVAAEPHLFHVRTSPNRKVLLASGYLRGSGTARVSLTIGSQVHREWQIGEHFTIRAMIDPLRASAAYVPLIFDTTSSVVFTDLWLEPEGQPLIRLSDGFWPPERDARARLFRWIAPHATATAYLPRPRGRLVVEGEIPANYYNLPLRLSMKWKGRKLPTVEVKATSFRIEQELDGSVDQPWGELTLDSSQSFVPGVRQRNGDRRMLSARIYRLALE
jgi:hypothetical protein